MILSISDNTFCGHLVLMEDGVNGDGSKRKRKNMNLSEKVFRRLNKLKRQDERAQGKKLPWDVFLNSLADHEDVRREVQLGQ